MIKVRLADKSEIDRLVELCAQNLTEKWSRQSFETEFDRNSVILCADDDGTVIGFSVTCVSFDEGYLDLVAVSPDYRRQGIARQLLVNTERELKSRGVTHIVLDVRISNPAVELYKSCGYATLCTRRDFYSNPREDAFTMQKEIGEV